MKSEITAGLVSSAVAIPLSMAFGMFAFVSLGDEYFAYGAMAGLVSAVIAGLVCVLIGDRSTRIYAPRITTTFFLGLLLHSLLERTPTIDGEPDVAATLLVFFAIILFGGLLQALFGLLRLGIIDQIRAASGHGRLPEHGGGSAVPGAARQRAGL